MNRAGPALPVGYDFPIVHRRRQFLFWVLEISGWGGFFTAMFLAGISQWSAEFTVVNKGSLALIGLFITLGLRAAYRTMAGRALGLPARITAAVVLSCAAAAPWMAAHRFVMATYRQGVDAALRAFPDFTNSIYYAFVLIAWSVSYFAIDQWLDRQDDRERLLRAEALARESTLRALRLQLDPHFLFNALNGVSTLISEGRNAEANRMLQSVSAFLRATLDRTDRSEVSLAEEIDYAGRYLEIQKIRFGDRLRVQVDVAPDLRAALVPPMILQPLVENAIRHGIVPREEGGSIRIQALRSNGDLRLSVEDDGPGLREADIRPGVGLTNTRERLRELYGEGSALELSRTEGGFTVSLTLPLPEGAG